MKKIVNPIPAGGFPLTNYGLLTLQDNLYQTIHSLYDSIAVRWVVSGCKISNINITASTCSMSAGYVFLDSELRAVKALENTPYPFYIIPATPTYETRQYGNGAVQNAFVLKEATTTTSKPVGTDNYLTFAPDNTTQRLNYLITGDLAAALAQESQYRTDGDIIVTNKLNQESQYRTDGDIILQNNINTLAGTVSQKQNRITTRIPWTTIKIDNPFYSTSDNPNDPNSQGPGGYKYSTFQMMRTEDGIVHMRGYLKGNGGGVITNIPLEFRPKNDTQHAMSYITYQSTTPNYPYALTTIHTIDIDPYGNMFHQHQIDQKISDKDVGAFQLIGFHPWFVLDGFSYSVE